MNHETLWAREGDRMLRDYPHWSPFASNMNALTRSVARELLHGYDFRVESQNGTKTMIIEEAP